MAISVYFDGKLIKQLGAYVKTDLSAVKQINGVGTGIVALLGLAEGGETYKPYRLTSFAEAVSIFKGGPLLEHIKAAFIGGAGEVVAVRIGNPTTASVSIPVAQNTSDTSPANLNFVSYEASTRSNQIYVSFDLDENFTSANEADDTIIFTIYQKHPDFSVTRETFTFPRKFTTPTVLVKRGSTLFFVDRSIVNAALAAGPAFQTALINLLKEQLQPTDVVQIFDASDTNPVDIPLGLFVYEVLYGGLFGFTKSRLVKTSFGTVDDLLSNPLLFNLSATPFFDGSDYQDYTSLSDPANWFAKDAYTINHLVDTTINPHILATRIFSLSGGTNGDDGTGYYQTAVSNYINIWSQGLATLEEEEVNFVIPAYKFTNVTQLNDRLTIFKGIASTFLSHVQTMSQVNRRKARVGVFGLPAPSPNESVTASEYLYNRNILNTISAMFGGTDRAQAVVFPFYSNVFNDEGKVELLGGEFFASYVAGMHANREPQDSITFLPISGIGAEPLYNWTYTQKDDLISNRVLFVEKVKTSFGGIVYRIHHNPTTWLGPVTQGFQEFVLRRIDDFLQSYVYKNLQEQFIGRKSYGRKTENDIKVYTEALLSNLVGKQIVAYKDVKVTSNEDKTVYYVEFFYQPVTEIKFILVTMKVTFDLE
ncbi:tail sheath [Thermus phage phiYS40]|uniref:tail sheath n=1 Tax=Thermus phage phiYS40 TaxID=407392 RepID=UPI0000E689BB|nr:tail sheath [Thermus phage phiYS40]ABJ91463.1 tail sheath protein [Thermus phage phiYS40]BAK53587.1 tail sheath protein [Thermus phage phiYS40]